MSEDRYRQLVRAGLAPWVEGVPEGREWSELEEVTPIATRRARRGVPGWIVAVGAAAIVMAVFGVTSLLSPTEETPTASTTPTVTSAAIDTEPPVLELQTNSRVFFSDGFGLLTEVDIDAGSVTVHELPELAPGDPLYSLVSRGEVLVFYGHTDVGPAAFAVDPDTLGSPTLIDDEAWFFVPSAIEDRVWIAVLDPSSPATVRALKAVREVTVDGTVTTADVAPPDGRWPIAAVVDGLVFQGDDVLEIWDPQIQELVKTVPGPFVVAAWGNRIVTCNQQCDQLDLIDLDADTRRTIDVPVGAASANGAFSPDGRYIVMPALLGEGPLTPETELVVILVDFETGEASVIPGTLTENRFTFPGVAWSSDGEWVFMGPFAADGDSGELRAYRPRDDTAYRIPVELEPEYFGMAAG
jgi:hypothetical protein